MKKTIIQLIQCHILPLFQLLQILSCILCTIQTFYTCQTKTNCKLWLLNVTVRYNQNTLYRKGRSICFKEKKKKKKKLSPSQSSQKPQLLCGCDRRSRLWWGRPRRSSPRRLLRTRAQRCRKCVQRQSSPSGPTWSLLPLCCPHSPDRRRNLPRLQQCSVRQARREKCEQWSKLQH